MHLYLLHDCLLLFSLVIRIIIVVRLEDMNVSTLEIFFRRRRRWKLVAVIRSILRLMMYRYTTPGPEW